MKAEQQESLTPTYIYCRASSQGTKQTFKEMNFTGMLLQPTSLDKLNILLVAFKASRTHKERYKDRYL